MPAVSGQYFDVLTPTTGANFTTCARGDAADIELALDAAHAAADAWGRTSASSRAALLQKVATIIRDNNELLSYVETIDNGKPIREVCVCSSRLRWAHALTRTHADAERGPAPRRGTFRLFRRLPARAGGVHDGAG